MTFFQTAWPEMSPIQREQYHVLFALIAELKSEVAQHLSDNDVLDVEPRFRSPRSSLHPSIVASVTTSKDAVKTAADTPISQQKEIERG